MKVLVACEYSGRVREAFRKRGHDAWSCDLLESEDGSPYHIQGNILDFLAGRPNGLYGGVEFQDLSVFDKEKVNLGILEEDIEPWDLLIAHPPCTRLTNSGVRWLHVPPPGKTKEQMWQELEQAANFYKALRDSGTPKKALENPIMHKYARELIGDMKRQVVQPWWFGEEAFKATGFELFGLPELKPTNKLVPPKPGTEEHKLWSKIHRASPGPNRWKERSRTFEGIAEAMAEQWG